LGVLLVLVLAAYTVATYIIAGTIFGMLVVLCLLAVLSLGPFFRFSRTSRDIEWQEFLWYYAFWGAGVVYWCFYRESTVFAMIWCGWYILCLLAMVIQGALRNIKRTYIYLLVLNILLTMVFVCLLLFLTVSVFPATLVTVILVMLSVGAVPIAYSNLEGHIPTPVKATCGLVIGVGVGSIAGIGLAFDVASNFAVFSFVMACIYLVLFVMAIIMYIER
jgi:hypothetical protein